MASNNQDSGHRSVGRIMRVFVADDHEIVRRGVRDLIETRPGWQIVGEAGDGGAALTAAIASSPDIAVVDYSLPTLNGAELARKLIAAVPAIQILIFTMHDREAIIRDVLTAGARGFLLKSDAERHLHEALDALARRRPYFTGKVNEALLAHFVAQASEQPDSLLTPREREVVQLIAEGRSSIQASHVLNISVKTVETHRAAIMRKLKLDTTAALVRYAIRNNFVEP